MLLISTAATLNTATTKQSFSQKGHAQTQGKSKVLPPRTLPGDINHAGAKIGQEFYINVISNIVRIELELNFFYKSFFLCNKW